MFLDDVIEYLFDKYCSSEEEREEYEPEVFQYYITDMNDQDYARNEALGSPLNIVFNSSMGLYVLLVMSFGTSWEYLMTDVKLEVI